LSSSAKAPPVYVRYVGLDPAVQVSARITIPSETSRTYYCALNWHGGHAGLRLGEYACDRQAVFCVWDATDGAALSEEHECEVGADRTMGVPGAVLHHAPFSWEEGGVYEFVLQTDWRDGRTFIRASVTEILAGGAAAPTLSLGTVSLPGRHPMSELGSQLLDVTPNAESPGGRIPLRRMKVGHVTAWSEDQGHVCRNATWSSLNGMASDGPVSAFGYEDWFWLESGTGISPAHRPGETLTTERPRPLRGGAHREAATIDTAPPVQ
jgi:hypothetical protein